MPSSAAGKRAIMVGAVGRENGAAKRRQAHAKQHRQTGLYTAASYVYRAVRLAAHGD